jgi:hypothetical protein
MVDSLLILAGCWFSVGLGWSFRLMPWPAPLLGGLADGRRGGARRPREPRGRVSGRAGTGDRVESGSMQPPPIPTPPFAILFDRPYFLHLQKSTGDDELRVYKRIVRCAPSFPPLLGPEAKDLLGQLLVRDPNARLGMVGDARR